MPPRNAETDALALELEFETLALSKVTRGAGNRHNLAETFRHISVVQARERTRWRRFDSPKNLTRAGTDLD